MVNLGFDRNSEADTHVLADLLESLGIPHARRTDEHYIGVPPEVKERVVEIAGRLGLTPCLPGVLPKDADEALRFYVNDRSKARKPTFHEKAEHEKARAGHCPTVIHDGSGPDWVCCLPPGHKGDHVAFFGPEEVVARWENK